jgi:hypothetical protein
MVLSVLPSSLATPEVPVSSSECSLDYHSSVFIRIRLCLKRRAWMGFAGGCIGSMSIGNVCFGDVCFRSVCFGLIVVDVPGQQQNMSSKSATTTF